MEREILDSTWEGLRARIQSDLCTRGLPELRVVALLDRLEHFYHKYCGDEFDLALPLTMTPTQMDTLKESLRENMSRLMSRVMFDFIEVEAHRMFLEIELEELTSSNAVC
ncbi:MAG: hypothetical protein HOC74_10715 [Gemmatimonadetes bacterium]|nr:hypothetical protein [Gemmatimonadota bacterium]